MKTIIRSTCALMLAVSITGCAGINSTQKAASTNTANIPAPVQKMNTEMVNVMKLDETTADQLLQLNLKRHNRFHEIRKSEKNDQQKKVARDANFKEFMASVEGITTPEQMRAWQTRRR